MHLSWLPGLRDPVDGPDMHLTGSGEYEGLSAILAGTVHPDGGYVYPRFAVAGIVFPGDLPPSDR